MPLLSIIIPTHERFRYARETVDAVLRMSNDIEVIVSDTSLVDPWRENGISDRAGQLKIVRPGTGISVVDNFNEALQHATGDYLCFIGDDDLITTPILDLTRWAQGEAVDAIRLTFPILFYWPDYQHRTDPEAYSGTIWSSPYTGSTKPLDTRASIANAAAQFGRGVFDMPRAYCGIVSRQLVDRILADHGALFGGVSPDIYSAALLAAYAQNAIEVDFPVIIPGASGASTAGLSAAGRHVGGLRDNAHIRPFRDLVWHPHIPEFYSVPTVWSYSFARALERLDNESLARANWGRLYAQCLMYHRSYRRETLAAMRSYAGARSMPALAAGVMRGVLAEIGWAIGRVRHRIAVRRGSGNNTRIAGVLGIDDALSTALTLISDGPQPGWLVRT